jgi:hypothetical protein
LLDKVADDLKSQFRRHKKGGREKKNKYKENGEETEYKDKYVVVGLIKS